MGRKNEKAGAYRRRDSREKAVAMKEYAEFHLLAKNGPRKCKHCGKQTYNYFLCSGCHRLAEYSGDVLGQELGAW